MGSAIEAREKYGPEQALVIQTIKAKNGFISPPKIWHSVAATVDRIVIKHKSLRYCEVCLQNDKYLDRKEEKRVMEIVRSGFPKDYFKKRAGREYVRKNPHIIKLKRDDRQLQIQMTSHFNDM